MQPSRQAIEAFLQRLKDGDCTQEEINLFKQWIATAEFNEVDKDLTPEWLASVKARMYQQLMQELRAAPVIPVKRGNLLRRYAAAAAIVLTLAAGMLVWFLKGRQTSQGMQEQLALSVIENDRHVVRKVTMPDGTIVWLNRHSRLEFDHRQYNQVQRCVKLYGEGYFEVVKDPAKPFIVETGNIQTRVLGTAFNIEAYALESEIRVSLVHGKVALTNKTKSLSAVLAPNQTMRYSHRTGRWQLLPMAVNNIEAWTRGALVLNEVPLEEALQRIGNRYQVSITYDKSLLINKRITANLSVNNLETALHNILFVHGLHFSVKGGTVVITQ